jgi:hypothetical protein
MKIRYAKIFDGTKNHPSFRTELQYSLGCNVWKSIPTEWASKQDEEKHNAAAKREYLKELR